MDHLLDLYIYYYYIYYFILLILYFPDSSPDMAEAHTSCKSTESLQNFLVLIIN